MLPSKHSKNHPKILKRLLDQGRQPNFSIEWYQCDILKKRTEVYGKQAIYL